MSAARGPLSALTPDMPFFVIQCFDDQGYHSSVCATTLEECTHLASKKTNKMLRALSLPFEGTWSSSGIPDVTMPADFKAALAVVNKDHGDD